MADQDPEGQRPDPQGDALCRDLLNAVGDVAFAVSRDGRLIALNPAFEAITGWSREEWLGKQFAPLFHADDAGRANQIFGAAMRGDFVAPPFELRVRKKSGGYWIGEFASRVQIKDGEITGVLGIARDITARKRTEDELRLLQTMTLAISEASDFRSALMACLQRVCEATEWAYGEAWIPDTRGEKLVAGPVWHGGAPGLKEFGQASRPLTFVCGAGLPGRVWQTGRTEWVADVSAETAPAFFRADLAAEAGLHAALGVSINGTAEVQAVLVFYMTHPQSQDPRMVEVVSVAAAQLGLIIHRKRVEDALRESERRFSAAFNGSPLAISISGLENGEILDVNEAGLRMMKYRREEVIGQPAVGLGWWGSAGEREEMIARLRQGPIQNLEIELPAKGGQKVNGLASFELIDLGGESAVLTLVNDVTDRKKSEEERAKLSRAVEQTADTVMITDPEGVIEYVNPAFEQTTGHASADVLGKRPSVLKSGEHEPWFYEDLWRAIRAGQPFTAVFKNRKRDGSVYFEEKTITPLRDAAGRTTHYVATGKDITARVQAEEAVRHYAERLANAQRIARIGNWEWEIETDTAKWSEEVFTIFGLPPDTRPGRRDDFMRVVHRDDREVVRNAVDTALRDGTRYSVDHRIVMAHGREVAVHAEAEIVTDEGGKPVRMVGIVQDITARVQAEEAVRHYAERLAILRGIDQAILAATSPEAIAREALRRVKRLVPYRRATLITIDVAAGEAILAAVHTDTRTRVRPGLRLPLEEMFEVNPYLVEGKIHYVEDVDVMGDIHPLQKVLRREGLRSYVALPLLAEGELVGSLNLWSDGPSAFSNEHLAVAREVADQIAVAVRQARLAEQIARHAAELETRVQERTAALQEANEELEAFAHSVAHDLRTPLRGINTLSHILIEDFGASMDPAAAGHLRHIAAAAVSMDQLIDDLLAYSRVARGNGGRLQRIDLAQAVDDALGVLRLELAQRGADVAAEGALPTVRGQRRTLVQVLANLISNGAKFVAPGVTPRVRIRAEKRGKGVRLWVEDNGIGIEPEQQEKIFGIFERLHDAEEYPGTGIGLAIVRKGAERMGGSAGVESRPGEGSRFWVDLRGA